MEGPNWVMLVCSWPSFQYKIHQKQRQIYKSVDSTSVTYNGDDDDATDSSQCGGVGNARGL